MSAHGFQIGDAVIRIGDGRRGRVSKLYRGEPSSVGVTFEPTRWIQLVHASEIVRDLTRAERANKETAR